MSWPPCIGIVVAPLSGCCQRSWLLDCQGVDIKTRQHAPEYIAAIVASEWKATLGYDVNMTGQLEEAVRRLEVLPADEQDAMASQIMETLDDEKAWADRFRSIPSTLRDMARQAGAEHRRGETRPLDELTR
jgi:hypothetical protein